MKCLCHVNVIMTFRGNNFLERRRVKSVRYDTESISFLASKIWETLPNGIKDSDILQIFNAKIKQWFPVKYPCRLSKIYLPQIDTQVHTYIHFI